MKDSPNLLQKVWRLTRPYGLKKAALVFLMMLIQGLLQVVGVASIFPFLVLATDPTQFRESIIGREVIMQVPDVTDPQLLLLFGTISILLLLGSNILNLASEYLRARYAHSFGHWLRLRLLHEMISQPWSYFLTANTGILLKKTVGDVMLMVYNVLLPLLDVVSKIISTLFLIVLIFYIIPSEIAATSVIALVIFYAGIFRFLRSRRIHASETLKICTRGSMKESQQLLGGIKPIRLSHSESFFLDRYATYSQTLGKIHAKLPIYYMIPRYLLEPIVYGGIIAIIMAYAYQGKDFSSLLPILSVIGFAAYRLMPATQSIYSGIFTISAGRYATEEVYEEFVGSIEKAKDRKSTPVDFEIPTPLPFKREIKFHNVTFAFPRTPKPVIDNLTLTIPKGSMTGVVGVTGRGKSTLVDLLLGLHLPQSGKITVDDRVIDSTSVRAWQAGISCVPQDIFLIDDTIERNIGFGLLDHKIDQKQLRWAAEAAQIHSFVANDLPDGYKTIIGERGIRLSGGQKQRIGIARALYRNPELLVLDESTSALDTQTETDVMETVRALSGKITMVIVAHRLSTIEGCDRLIEL